MSPDKSRTPAEQRTARLELRAQPAREARIRYAAQIENRSVSAFVLDAAAERAEEVIAASAETVVPADFFDELFAALDAPPEKMGRLSRAARKPRTFGQG